MIARTPLRTPDGASIHQFSEDDSMPSTQQATIEVVTDATLAYRVHGQVRTVFRHLSLSMQSGTCLALIGPNACGKSSLLRAILGLTQLDEGILGLHLSHRDF